MVAGVADTHAALWHLYGDARLFEVARRFIEDAAVKGRKVALSSISLAEVVYLVEKGRIRPDAYQDLTAVLNDPSGVFEEVPVDQKIINSMRHVARDEVSDMPDRIVAATGLRLAVPVISRDGRIRAALLQTIW